MLGTAGDSRWSGRAGRRSFISCAQHGSRRHKFIVSPCHTHKQASFIAIQPIPQISTNTLIMHQQTGLDDLRSTVSVVDQHPDARRPALRRGRSNTYSGYRPYEDALYYNGTNSKQPWHAIARPRRHSVQRRTRCWEDSDSDSSDTSDDEYHRRPRSHSRSRGRSRSRRLQARNSSSSSRSVSCSRSRRGRRGPAYRPKETHTLTKALKSAAMAATVEAVRCRAEPGPWRGQKSHRIAVAAASGAAVGSLRNGRLQKSGKLPYAEAAMTGAYSVDFLKRVLRQTNYVEDAERERKEREVDEDVYDERRRYARSRSRRR